MRVLCLPLLGIALALPPVSLNAKCRDVKMPVRYLVPHAHSEPGPKYTRLLNVVNTAGKLTLTVSKPVWNKPHWYGAPDDFASSDLGKTWKTEYDDLASPLAEASGGYQSLSNPQVRYLRLSDVDLYLRTTDGGKTWILPAYSVEGMSLERYATQKGGSRSYHVKFTMLAIHPREPFTVYAALQVDPWAYKTYELPRHEIRGVYVSRDGGENWHTFSSALLTTSPMNAFWPPPLGISPANPSVMFGQSKVGLVKSRDGGRSWSAVGQQQLLQQRPLYDAEQPENLRKVGLPENHIIPGFDQGMAVSQFLFHPTNEQVLYVVSNKGVHRTLDGGNTWVLLDLGFDVIRSVNTAALHPLNPQEVFVSTDYGLYFSRDQGCSFTELTPPENYDDEVRKSQGKKAGRIGRSNPR